MTEWTPQLIRAAFMGDEELAGRLFDDVLGWVRKRAAFHAGRRRRDPVEARELVNVIFEALYEKGGKALRDWDPTLGRKLESWVSYIASHAAYDYFLKRDRVHTREVPSDDLGAGGNARVEDLERYLEYKRIAELVGKEFGPVDLKVFALRFIDGCKASEIGVVLGLSTGAVEQRLRRLKKRLRTWLNE